MQITLLNKSTVAAAAIAAAMMAGDASAATVVTTDLSYQGGNDCAGYFSEPFGTGFEVCNIFVVGDEDVKLSPVIGKWEVDEEEWEINTALFPTFTGDEITIPDDTQSTGTWTYAPGMDDPGIRYWVAKGGSGGQFRLHWTVEDAVATSGFCSASNKYTLDCLSAALVVEGGTWSTVSGSSLSHITFYDTDGPTSVIPLPAAGWLLLAGIGGLAAMRRRKKSA
jgi:hypothetical protein